jgi:uncharacterized protein (DUF2062 family)
MIRNDNRPFGERVIRGARELYIKFISIDDPPQKIAAGLSLGVFTGIIPGAGPIAALFLAVLLKTNKASALLGSVITNTWISIAAFVLSLRIGGMITGVEWHTLEKAYLDIAKDFHLSKLFQEAALKLLLPVTAGFIAVALLFAAAAYVLALFILLAGKRKVISSRK